MATATLTPKQQQVKKLLDEGKSPAEVAKKLKVNVNSVYQHIRRMRAAEGGTAAKPKRTTRKAGTRRASTRKTTGRKTGARRSTTRRTRPAPAPAPAPVAESRPMTPLQAIRHRKSELESQLRESMQAVLAAEKVHKDAKDAHAKLEAARSDELNQLAKAEGALSGKAPAKPRSRSGSSSKNGSGSKTAGKAAAQTAAPAPAAPAATPEPQSAATPEPDPTPAENAGTTGSTTDVPEPVEPPQGDEALAAVGVEQERPGVETVPEFAGEDDPFA